MHIEGVMCLSNEIDGLCDIIGDDVQDESKYWN